MINKAGVYDLTRRLTPLIRFCASDVKPVGRGGIVSWENR